MICTFIELFSSIIYCSKLAVIFPLSLLQLVSILSRQWSHSDQLTSYQQKLEHTNK